MDYVCEKHCGGQTMGLWGPEDLKAVPAVNIHQSIVKLHVHLLNAKYLLTGSQMKYAR